MKTRDEIIYLTKEVMDAEEELRALRRKVSSLESDPNTTHRKYIIAENAVRDQKAQVAILRANRRHEMANYAWGIVAKTLATFLCGNELSEHNFKIVRNRIARKVSLNDVEWTVCMPNFGRLEVSARYSGIETSVKFVFTFPLNGVPDERDFMKCSIENADGFGGNVEDLKKEYRKVYAKYAQAVEDVDEFNRNFLKGLPEYRIGADNIIPVAKF